jgi:hypothetical protein
MSLDLESQSKPIRIASVRPSLIDWRFTADAWIFEEGDGTLTLRLGDYNLARITGLSLDLPSLNQILNRLWNRRPRAPRPA